MDFPGSSLCGQIWKHDVFLSFNGEDSWDFAGNLSAALQRAGLTIFRDDDKTLKRRQPIPSKLLKEMEESKVFIIVFSKSYVKSTHLLGKLVKIAESLDAREHSVLPIFCHVKPSEVPACFEYSREYNEHEKGLRGQVLLKLERWAAAVTPLTNGSGLIVGNKLASQAVIDYIVKRAVREVDHKVSSLAADDVVGMQSCAEKLEKLLDLGSEDVRFVGIYGMGGIGKTTLAANVYDEICHQFDSCCFLADLSQVFGDDDLINLQEQLLSECKFLEDEDIRSVHEGALLIRNRLSHCKTLLVLDDVDRRIIMKALAGNANWFGAGSRVIITSRDEHLCAVDEVFRVELLNKEEARRLFCRNAFKWDYPLSGYEELTNSALEYAKGLPLAIKSLASMLLDRPLLEWKIILAKQQKIPNNLVMSILRKSFDGLKNMEKEIFLDIACFFVGEKIDYVKQILRCCGYHPKIGFKILIEKSLMTISDQRIQMHYMLQELGREIVRRQSPEEPGERSRLWLYNDFRRVMEANTGAKNLKAIVLNLEEPEGSPLEVDAFSKMNNLRLLIIRNVNFSGSLTYLSNKLEYLSWHKYPFYCLPSSFHPRRLVMLNMPDSNLTKLWEDHKSQFLPNLRSINLCDSKNLIEMPHLGGLRKLERLDLEGSTRLLQLHPSITLLPKLTFLNLRNCTSLVIVPNDLFGLSSLEILNLAGC